MPQVLASMLGTYRSLAKPNQLERLRREGRSDAKQLGDDAGRDHLQVRLRSLDAEADDVKSRYDAHYGERLREYEEDIRRLDEEVVRVFTDQEDRLRREKEEDVRELYRTLGPGSETWKSLAAEDDATKRAYDQHKVKLNGRPPRIHMRYTYLPFMGVLSVVESPINRLAFELFFGSAPIVALAVAFAAGATLIFLAHELGIRLVRWPSMNALKRYGGTGLVVLLAGLVIYGLGVLRNEFTLLVQSSGPSLGELLSLDSFDLESFGAAVAPGKLGSDALALLGINLGLFAMGTIASIQRHDPDPDYETIYRQHQKARKKFDVRKSEYDKANRRIYSDYDPQIEQVAKATEDARQQLAEISAAHETWVKRADGDNESIFATHRQRRSQYMAGYLEGCANSHARSEITDMLNEPPPDPDGENVVGMTPRAGTAKGNREG